MTDLTGDSTGGPLRLDFDRRLMLRFRGAVITSGAGLIAYRENDAERLCRDPAMRWNSESPR